MSEEWQGEDPTEFEIFERKEFVNYKSAAIMCRWAKQLGLVFVYRFWRGKHNVWRLR